MDNNSNMKQKLKHAYESGNIIKEKGKKKKSTKKTEKIDLQKQQ